jgi:hypothetical protein
LLNQWSPLAVLHRHGFGHRFDRAIYQVAVHAPRSVKRDDAGSSPSRQSSRLRTLFHAPNVPMVEA